MRTAIERHRTVLNLPKVHVDKLEQLAARKLVSRTAVVQEMIDAMWQEQIGKHIPTLTKAQQGRIALEQQKRRRRPFPMEYTTPRQNGWNIHIMMGVATWRHDETGAEPEGYVYGDIGRQVVNQEFLEQWEAINPCPDAL